MRIGIYGDSFAENREDAPVQDGFHATSWIRYLVNLLEQDIKERIVIDNYSRGGSSLYFSYKNLLMTLHNNYDLIIFLATDPHRYPGKVIINGQRQYITSVPHVENIKNNNKNELKENELQLLDNLNGWFSTPNHDFNDDMSDLMLNEIERINSNIIIYPCFMNSFLKERFNRHNLDPELHPCHSFWYRQLELLDIPWESFNAQEKPTLFGHLTPEFNKYFAKVLYSKYKTGKWDHSGFFDIKLDKPKTYYYANWDN